MKSQRSGFQGELGAFSQEATHQLLGPKTKVVPYPTFESVFAALRAGKIDSAVIPMENTLAGSVHENYDIYCISTFALPRKPMCVSCII